MRTAGILARAGIIRPWSLVSVDLDYVAAASPPSLLGALGISEAALPITAINVSIETVIARYGIRPPDLC